MIGDSISTLRGYELLQRLYGQRNVSSYLATSAMRSQGPDVVVHVQDRAGSNPTDWLRRVERLVGYSHPRVVPILDIGAIDGCGFVVTPFIEGRHILQAWA